MSDYRILVISPDERQAIKYIDFDNKEDAEHYAKNRSLQDAQHSYEVQKNHHGEFVLIKAYKKGQITTP